MSDPVRVLIVDDSLTMRTLFSEVLDSFDNIQVVGVAANADEARERITELSPQVITLDVEMPGMSGIEFLEEIMKERPMPVIMLSTLTQRGAEISLRALELGAFECFPKPQNVTLEVFKKLGPKLAELIVAAAGGKIRKKTRQRKVAKDELEWNGKMIALATSTGGVDAMLDILPEFPANCPPTLIVQPLDDSFTEIYLTRLGSAIKPQVKLAKDGAKLKQGVIYIASDTNNHVVIDRWPNPTIRLLPKEPVQGHRPSASLLFAALAKTAKDDVVAGILTGVGDDGVAGMRALKASGAFTFAQDQETAIAGDAPRAARDAKVIDQEVAIGDIASVVLAKCQK